MTEQATGVRPSGHALKAKQIELKGAIFGWPFFFLNSFELPRDPQSEQALGLSIGRERK
jgi:hypothetical protein